MSDDDLDGDIEDLQEQCICVHCVGDAWLKAHIRKHGDKADCFYCERNAKTISVGDLAGEIGDAFDRHYYRTPTEPVGIDYILMKETGSWDRPGTLAAYAIGDAASLDEAPAEDVRAILEERRSDFDSAAAGEEGEFDAEAHYEFADTDSAELHHEWNYFKQSLKKENRLFNSTVAATLDRIFAGVDELKSKSRKLVIVEAGPERRLSKLYRSRVFQSDEKIERALEHPEIELGPPPFNLAPAGRMNARGIAVFYGATDSRVALSETRPPVGARVLVASFTIARELRLLDVSALESMLVEGSIFDRTFAERLKMAVFLASLSKEITQPVMPEDEPFEYLATQAIADYLAARPGPGIDGIIYRSAQSGKKRQNVVLFHKASRVAPTDLPPGSEVSASLYEHNDDGIRPDYRVFEEVPETTTVRDEDDDIPDPPCVFDLSSFLAPPTQESREITLKLARDSIKIHHVDSVKFSTNITSVPRHRSVKRKHDKF